MGIHQSHNDLLKHPRPQAQHNEAMGNDGKLRQKQSGSREEVKLDGWMNGWIESREINVNARFNCQRSLIQGKKQYRPL
jgi:hypothetical protein